MVPNVSISWFKNPFGAIFLAKNHLFHGGTVADWPPGPWWWKKGLCLFIALMHHQFHLSRSNHVFSLSVECRLSSPPPLLLPGSITSFQLAVLMITIHLLPSSSFFPLHPLPFLYCSVTSSQFAILTGSFICPSLSLLKQFTLGYLQMRACMCCHEQTQGERLGVHVNRKIERQDQQECANCVPLSFVGVPALFKESACITTALFSGNQPIR